MRNLKYRMRNSNHYAHNTNIYDVTYRRPNEKESNQYHRINEIANFSKYLNSLGLESFVPRVNFRGRSNFVPYIFSYEEIERFFIACDQILITSYTIQGSISPALFRLLYGCGLRISEALSLAYHDVNLNERFLIVRSSKNTTERVLPFTDSVFEVLSAYKNYRNRLNVSSDYFFIKKNGEKCTPDAAYRSFRTVLIAAGIPHGGKNQGPRLHDIRHSFSVHSLASMAESGLDLYYSLPILSKYLGHRSLDATDKYVRLTADIYPELINEMDSLCAYVFPEVHFYETK